MSYLILTPASQLSTMALSQHQAHPNPILLFYFFPSLSPIETFVFLSYSVNSHTPTWHLLWSDHSCNFQSPCLTVPYSFFFMWYSFPDCFQLDCIPFCHAQEGSYWAQERSGSVQSAPLVHTAWRKPCLPPALPWSRALAAVSGAFSCPSENMYNLQIFFKGLSHSQNCVVSHKKRRKHISSKDWLLFPVIFRVLFQAWSPRTSQWNRVRLFYFNEGQRAHFSLMSSSEDRYILWNLHMWMGPCLWGGFTWAKV